MSNVKTTVWQPPVRRGSDEVIHPTNIDRHALHLGGRENMKGRRRDEVLWRVQSADVWQVLLPKE